MAEACHTVGLGCLAWHGDFVRSKASARARAGCWRTGLRAQSPNETTGFLAANAVLRGLHEEVRSKAGARESKSGHVGLANDDNV